MALTDNRTKLQDCESSTDVASDSSADPQANTSETGVVIEGTNALQFQVTNSQEYLAYDQDAGGSTFNLDLSDSTIYLMIKDNLHDSFAGLGGQVVLADTADGASTHVIGYAVAGYDVIGLPYEKKYSSMKLDVSVIVATPGVDNTDFYTHSGTEATLDQTIIKQIGYGSIHLIKGQGTIPNTWFDGIYYIANDSYAATITGGTVGTPETMADVVGDDITLGAGMFSNPVGASMYFFAPTEFGDAGTADSYITSTAEQWYWLGDNGGGHSVGLNHFPMRLIGNSTGTNSWVLVGTQIINVGQRADFDMSDANMDFASMLGGSLSGAGLVSLPASGSANRFTTGVIFQNINQITNNGADMDGCSLLESIVAADVGALLYNEASDPDGTLDNLTIVQGAAAHHAIDFGTNVDSSLTEITIRGGAFDGFAALADNDGSALRFLATTGALTVNIVDCTVDGAGASALNFFVDDAAGITITLVFDTIPLKVTVTDATTGLALPNARVYLHKDGDTGTVYFEDDCDVNGEVNAAITFPGVTDAVGWAREMDETGTDYHPKDIAGQISSTGLDISVALEPIT